MSPISYTSYHPIICSFHLNVCTSTNRLANLIIDECVSEIASDFEDIIQESAEEIFKKL